MGGTAMCDATQMSSSSRRCAASWRASPPPCAHAAPRSLPSPAQCTMYLRGLKDVHADTSQYGAAPASMARIASASRPCSASISACAARHPLTHGHCRCRVAASRMARSQNAARLLVCVCLMNLSASGIPSSRCRCAKKYSALSVAPFNLSCVWPGERVCIISL